PQTTQASNGTSAISSRHVPAKASRFASGATLPPSRTCSPRSIASSLPLAPVTASVWGRSQPSCWTGASHAGRLSPHVYRRRSFAIGSITPGVGDRPGTLEHGRNGCRRLLPRTGVERYARRRHLDAQHLLGPALNCVRNPLCARSRRERLSQ